MTVLVLCNPQNIINFRWVFTWFDWDWNTCHSLNFLFSHTSRDYLLHKMLCHGFIPCSILINYISNYSSCLCRSTNNFSYYLFCLELCENGHRKWHSFTVRNPFLKAFAVHRHWPIIILLLKMVATIGGHSKCGTKPTYPYFPPLSAGRQQGKEGKARWAIKRR